MLTTVRLEHWEAEPKLQQQLCAGDAVLMVISQEKSGRPISHSGDVCRSLVRISMSDDELVEPGGDE